MSKKNKKQDTEKPCKCGGNDPDCTICEGTGIVLFDENFDNAQTILEDDEYFDRED